MQVFDEIIHLEFFERRENRLAVVIAGDSEDAEGWMGLLPIAQEVRQALKQELRLFDGKTQR